MVFGPPPPLRKHVFSTENKQKLQEIMHFKLFRFLFCQREIPYIFQEIWLNSVACQRSSGLPSNGYELINFENQSDRKFNKDA